MAFDSFDQILDLVSGDKGPQPIWRGFIGENCPVVLYKDKETEEYVLIAADQNDIQNYNRPEWIELAKMAAAKEKMFGSNFLPQEGQLRFNNSKNEMQVFNMGEWQKVILTGTDVDAPYFWTNAHF